MDVAKVVRAVDDPEFAVACGEVENLLAVGEHDQGGKAELGMDGNNILLAVLHDAGALRRGKNGESNRRAAEQQQQSDPAKQMRKHGFLLLDGEKKSALSVLEAAGRSLKKIRNHDASPARTLSPFSNP